MYSKVKVIPRKVLRHVSGRTASLYGSAPRDPENWHIETSGYTWECTDHNGVVTIGACRQAERKFRDAQAVASRLIAA